MPYSAWLVSKQGWMPGTRGRHHDPGYRDTRKMVIHCVELHGGKKPRFLATITRVEPSALYYACREAVMIANQPPVPRNLNCCMEWGSPRVPVLVPKGGDEKETQEPPPQTDAGGNRD